MLYEIVNQTKSKSVIRLVGTGSQLITLANLEKIATESVGSASIATVLAASNGTWKVHRGNDATGTLVLELPGGADWPLSQMDISVANNNTSNIFVSNSGSNGTMILTVTKSATYTEPLQGI